MGSVSGWVGGWVELGVGVHGRSLRPVLPGLLSSVACTPEYLTHMLWGSLSAARQSILAPPAVRWLAVHASAPRTRPAIIRCCGCCPALALSHAVAAAHLRALPAIVHCCGCCPALALSHATCYAPEGSAMPVCRCPTPVRGSRRRSPHPARPRHPPAGPLPGRGGLAAAAPPAQRLQQHMQGARQRVMHRRRVEGRLLYGLAGWLVC